MHSQVNNKFPGCFSLCYLQCCYIGNILHSSECNSVFHIDDILAISPVVCFVAMAILIQLEVHHCFLYFNGHSSGVVRQ